MEDLKSLLIKEIEKEVERTIRNLAEKYNLNEEEALNFIKRKEETRGRPATKKEDKEKGPRGRPPKEEKEVTHYSGDDLISRLLEEARKKGQIV